MEKRLVIYEALDFFYLILLFFKGVGKTTNFFGLSRWPNYLAPDALFFPTPLKNSKIK